MGWYWSEHFEKDGQEYAVSGTPSFAVVSRVEGGRLRRVASLRAKGGVPNELDPRMALRVAKAIAG